MWRITIKIIIRINKIIIINKEIVRRRRIIKEIVKRIKEH